MDVVDSLAHITENGRWFNTCHNASLERLLSQIALSKVHKTVLVGLPSPYNSNKAVIQAYRHYPDKFLPVAAIDLQGQTDGQIEEQVIAFKSQGFLGVKAYPRLCGVSLYSEQIASVLQYAGKYNLVAYVCTVYKSPMPVLHRPVYDVIYELCERFQSTKIVLLHGGYYELLQTSEMIRPFENVLLDLSATLPRFYDSSIGRDILFLLRTFDKRICLGSDFPEFTVDKVLEALGKLLGNDISPLAYPGLMGENLLSFFQKTLK